MFLFFFNFLLILCYSLHPTWTKNSWKNFPIQQEIVYPDSAKLEVVEHQLEQCAPLVFSGEIRLLEEKLKTACLGNGFVLMGGDCAETFSDFTVNHIRDNFRLLLQMSLILTHGKGVPRHQNGARCWTICKTTL